MAERMGQTWSWLLMHLYMYSTFVYLISFSLWPESMTDISIVMMSYQILPAVSFRSDQSKSIGLFNLASLLMSWYISGTQPGLGTGTRRTLEEHGRVVHFIHILPFPSFPPCYIKSQQQRQQQGPSPSGLGPREWHGADGAKQEQ